MLLKMRAKRRQRQEQPGGARMTLQQGKRSGNLVMAAENVSFEYPGKAVIRDFSTTILRHDRVGIIGPNGCGKTTLLRLLLGELPPSRAASAWAPTWRSSTSTSCATSSTPKKRFSTTWPAATTR